MKKLIINADDFGLSEDINNGIIDCYKKGVITDISIISDADAFEHAVNLTRKNKINKIGLHVVLSEGNNPAVKYYRFPWKYVSGIISEPEIYSSIKNQVSRIKDAGFVITHLDSHQHIHMVPRMSKIFIKLAEEFNIKFLRFPYETGIFNFFDFKNTMRTFFLKSVCMLSKNILMKSGVKHNDYFYGHFYSGRFNKGFLFQMLSGIKEGITELSCHPGYLTEEIRSKYPWHRNCEDELLILSDPRFLEEVRKNHIALVSHADI